MIAAVKQFTGTEIRVDLLVTSITNQLMFKEGENMTYMVFYYDEENDNRSCEMFNNLDKAKEFSNEHFYSILCVPLADYQDISKKLDIKNAFLRDIKDMIERNM